MVETGEDEEDTGNGVPGAQFVADWRASAARANNTFLNAER